MATTAELDEGYRLGPWVVLPARNLIRRDGKDQQLEPQWMDTLQVLATNYGHVVSNDQIAEGAWDGRATSDEAIVRCISKLRQAFGDNPRQPQFIETLARRGYRLMVEPKPLSPVLPPRPKVWRAGVIVAALLVGIAVVWFVNRGGDDATPDAAAISLAVFPLECSAGDTVLCFGFAEELIGRLLEAKGQDESLKVVRSRQRYPGPGQNTIADELGVDALFVGSLSRVGEQVNVSVEINDRIDGFTLWAKSYSVPSTDMYQLRETLAVDVANHLLGRQGSAQTTATKPSSFEAADRFVHAQYEFSTRSPAAIRRAIALYRETVRLDPDFGPAYVWMGYAASLLPEYSNDNAAELYVDALMNADRGLRLDPAMAGLVHTIEGFIHHKKGQWKLADRAHNEALRATPVYPVSHHLFSRLLASVGRLDEALLQAQRAREIDPEQPVFMSRLAITYLWLDDLERAAKYFERANSHKEFEAPIHDLAYALFFIRKGDFEAAERATILGLADYNLPSHWVGPVFSGVRDPRHFDEAHRIASELSASGAVTADGRNHLMGAIARRRQGDADCTSPCD